MASSFFRDLSCDEIYTCRDVQCKRSSEMRDDKTKFFASLDEYLCDKNTSIV